MVNISQSFLKEYAKYKTGGACGLQVKAKYIDKVPFPQSDAMFLGDFFEYTATGSIPRSGVIPQPKLVYKGTAKESIAEPFKRALQSAELFKKTIKHYGIEIIETGKSITIDGMTGIMDIIANWNGRTVIIDTKYSGLLDDKWNDLGWDLDALPEKHGTMIQSVHYRILLAKELGCEPNDIDFYFFVFSTTNPNDAKIIKVISDEDTYANHEVTIEWMKEELKKPIDKLFKAKPTLKLCSDCPIKSDCKSAIDVPTINEVAY